MKKNIIVRLFILQKDLERINRYSAENCFALFRHAIAFEALLETMQKGSHADFHAVFNQFNCETQIYCRLCCEFTDAENNRVAFNTGLAKLNTDIKKCLSMLAVSHLHPPELAKK